ncbi:MAG: sodium:proton antiporter [Clostridia bacterium]|nr:sodium:proton antiporter [Clostridia bacterium]
MNSVISGFLMACMSVLVVLMLLCLYRAVRGPRFTDRIVMSNAISTMVVVLIVLLAVYLKEGYLLDVAAVYAMLGFLSVAVICRIAAFRVYGKKLHEDDEIDEVEELNHD